ncbi:MAG: TrpB-like pyridoxal phosphate-dependent enzyme [Candidatus Micrarchaeota archaeon]
MAGNKDAVKVELSAEELPKNYYNIQADLPTPLEPPLNPGTGGPISGEALKAIFPKEIVRQEMSQEKYIQIPEGVREAYLRLGRPTPLYRAKRLEAFLKTPAKIYYKREDVNPCGSHKPNTAIAQAYYSMREGVEALATETGAGQWGTALSYATMLFGLKCKVFMVRVSYDQKPHRKTLMNLYGAEVYPSPSDKTEFGRKLLEGDPNHPGSLGIAISEALEIVVASQNAKYALGSVLNHVLMHQTVIGQELMLQMARLDETPDVMIACVGGGSNFGGFAFPMMERKIKGKINTRFIAVEPTATPSITRGKYEYDFGDAAGMTPLLKMHTLGHGFVPPKIHAGGLRYHGMAPLVSLLANEGKIEARAVEQEEVFEAAHIFTKTEGILPAPESAHAIKVAIDEALACKHKGEGRTIVFNLSGHGLLDLNSYDQYLNGALE